MWAMKRKSDKNSQACYRTTRMYEEGSSWYFTTREATVMGPFCDELEASTQLEVYIRMVDSGLLPEQELYSPASIDAKSAG
jgi:hypothetical protein